mmetsp:Transcript_6859/g.19252  ORF Transcript_6859/g.19252 Transcript_6859/m.19252 type:complete len:163 (+) Transcript_6859:89-577(+)
MHKFGATAAVLFSLSPFFARGDPQGIRRRGPIKCDPETLEGCPEGLTCVTGGSKDWAQCVDCEPQQFAWDCPYLWHKDLTSSAEDACGFPCLGDRSSQCVTIPCNTQINQNLKCVEESEEWRQCVDCTDARFQEDCGYWSEKLSAAAEAACNAVCHSRTRLL